MTASPNIKTPAMEVPLLVGSNGEEDGVRLKKLFTRVLLKDVRRVGEGGEGERKGGRGRERVGEGEGEGGRKRVRYNSIQFLFIFAVGSLKGTRRGGGAREEGIDPLDAILFHTCQVLDKCEIWETMGREGAGFRHRLYRVKLSFLKHHYYKVTFACVVMVAGVLVLPWR